MNDTQEQGRVAVITGGSSGIGAATAHALADDGYRVALLAPRVDRITALADELGNAAIAIQADVTDRDALLAAADRVQQEFGGADVLVNNAGVMLLGPSPPTSARTTGAWLRSTCSVRSPPPKCSWTSSRAAAVTW